MNRYPLCAYIILVLSLIIGILYALPNLYGEELAVQITGVWGSTISESTLAQIRAILEKQHIISKSIVLHNSAILAHFSNSDMQFRAREALMSALGDNYIVAFNLAPATPPWLDMVGATPMKLGLDLRGGVYFLIEVDTNAELNKLQEQMIDILRSNLHEKCIPYTTMRKIENYGSEIRFRDTNTCNQAISLLRLLHRDVVINSAGDNTLRATLTDDHCRQACEHVVKQNITILRNRINQLGIAEPLVYRQGVNHIVIELPGIQDTAHAKEILKTTATIEFRMVNTSVNQTVSENNRIPEDSEVKITRDGRSVVLYKKVIMTGNHIINSISSINEYNRPQVNIFLDDSGGTIMSDFTKNNIGKLLATLFVEYKDSGKKDPNGNALLKKREEVINIATVQSYLGNRFRITGISNSIEAHQLSLLLRAGTLIAPIQIVEERIVGPSLGLQNITQGWRACLWGLLVSMLFMVMWYRIFGLIAITALIANLVFIIGIMSLLPDTTLTMPGIAGIVLTLAVAVDSNVLINERIKEELNNGCTVQKAIYEGYRGAFSSIVDANITTLITTIILYLVVGSGSVRGFAITTTIGIITSMFTAIIGTRAIVNLIYGGKYVARLPI